MGERYDSLAIARFFIDLAIKDSLPINPMKLQKLVYYAAGWYAGYTGLRLLNEEIKAWPHGPVIASIYSEFQHLGTDLIRARDVRFQIIDTGTPLFDKAMVDFLTGVWSGYRGYTAVQLSEFTSAPGSPWAKTRLNSPIIQSIPFPVFCEYFEKVVESVKHESSEGHPGNG